MTTDTALLILAALSLLLAVAIRRVRGLCHLCDDPRLVGRWSAALERVSTYKATTSSPREPSATHGHPNVHDVAVVDVLRPPQRDLEWHQVDVVPWDQ